MSLEDLGRAYHAEISPPWPYSAESLRAALDQWNAWEDGYVSISDTGFVAGYLVDNPLSPGWIIAEQVLWYGDADLIRGFRKWAIGRGANEIIYSSPPGQKATRFMAARGDVCDVSFSEAL